MVFCIFLQLMEPIYNSVIKWLILGVCMHMYYINLHFCCKNYLNYSIKI